MDLLTSSFRKKQEDARADPAIMLFGKQITKDGEKIKEELSPRGVDEKGLSFATSSDEDEDLNPSVEVAYEDAMHHHVEQSASIVMGSVLASEKAREHAKKRKSSEPECAARDEDAVKQNNNASECVTVTMGGDNTETAAKQKGGIWSRCPRCNSADTKFCYFNNYNVNQPRHFCKNCQRYWTAGGTLRNVPIGAGKRKNKHALHKHNFVANSRSAHTVPMPTLPLSIVKSDPLPTVTSDPLSIVKPDCVNTNLELSAHHSFTDSPTPSLRPCIQSQTTPINIIHPQSPHNLITLHQLHENLQSRLSQINHPHLATGYSKLNQMYPDIPCGPSTLSPIHPELAGGCTKLSQLCPDSASGSPGLSQKSPLLQNGAYGLSQICPHLQGGSSGLSQICPDLHSGYSEFARLGPHLQSGSSRLCYTCPHVQRGSCETSQEWLDCRRNELSEMAKSERGFSDIDEMKGNLESEQLDQKSASLGRGLPDLAKTAGLEKANLQNKARLLQIGYPEMDPNEANKYMQRCNEMKLNGCSSGSKECKNGLMPPLQGHVVKSEEAFNIENIMKRGVGEGHNSLPKGGPLWPCFYNMFWLDPLAFPHFNPILTPQGWALPFLPPSSTNMEPHGSTTSPTYVQENLDSSCTLTTSSTPTTMLPTFEDVSNGACIITTTSLGKRSATPTPTTFLGNFEDVTNGACNTATSSLKKHSDVHARFEDHDGFHKYKSM